MSRSGLAPTESSPSPSSGESPPARRRHGDVLRDAIYQACVEVLGEQGYAGLTMSRVATRAQTSKATLYRHWPSKVDLVSSVFAHAMPAFRPPPESGELRAELLELLRASAAELAGPTGAMLRGLIPEVVRNPELADILPDQLINPLTTPTMEVLRRAVVRGEAPAAALRPRVASVGSELAFLHFLLHGSPATEEIFAEIVDQAILPMIRGSEAE